MWIVNENDVDPEAEPHSVSSPLPGDRHRHETARTPLPIPFGDAAADRETNDAMTAEDEAGYGHGV